MPELCLQHCTSLSAGDQALDNEAAVTFLDQLEPRWQLNKENHTISHSYSFKNFYQTMAFVNVIAQIAHQQDHHPVMQISYNRCMVSYTTHSVGGLSINDFICAAKINAAQKL